MKRFLVCAGLDGREKGCEWLHRAVAYYRPDGVLFAGGIFDGPRQHAARVGHPWGLTHDEAQFLEHVFEQLGRLGVFTALIPGVADVPLEEFLRLGMSAEVEYPTLHLVHATLTEAGHTAFLGMGGCLVDGLPRGPEQCSRTVAEYHLRPLAGSRQPYKILLLADPPTGTLGGDEGNAITGEFIDTYHPTVCVVGGSTERRGWERVATTTVINPGRLADGCAAWLDWTRDGGDQVEILNLRELAPLPPVEVGRPD